ncbi:hypothetical protein [Oceanobacillus jeddahense]|uniref:Sodium:glutamate symporter n=1 Tax=Oceanobacillus jeddahense TaxID=1462527 RepID=A0ABY5JNK6_9BACI|nr:hypothetical protein [Oceanobacillus jeddahense]UUI01878.1 hypothetical protein NP439_17750 [Oceanobacillus jeddahense]
MAQMLALVLIVLILYIGDVVAARTKAWIPSIFVCAVLFLAGYWTFFPQDIVEIAGIPPVVATALMYLLIVNMGTLLSLQELKQQWRTILIAVGGILGVVVFLLSFGTLLFGFQSMVVAVPPLVGGLVSSLIMSEGAANAGLESLSVFAIVIYVMQGFAGYPLTSIMLKKEGKQLLGKMRSGELKVAETQVQTEAKEYEGAKLFRNLPEQYNTSYFIFFRLAVAGFLAYQISAWLEPIVSVSPMVLCLVFGVIGRSAGFLEKQALQKANGFGFAMLGLMLYILDGLRNATPTMMLDIVYLLIGSILLAVVGMYIFSFIVGKLFKVSKTMAYAISLTAFYGFPADYVITNEVINSLTKDQEEREVLTSHMLPPMLVGGFVTVTIVSVVLAGIFVNLL